MDRDPALETWVRLRREARRAAEGQQEVEQLTHAALHSDELARLAHLEQRLEQLNQVWPVHEKPLRTRIPLLGPFFSWLGGRLMRFLLQNQVVFNAEIAGILQELHQVQGLLAREQIERGDDLCSRLDERLLALDARLRDLESESARPAGPGDEG
jgi:hypothetical protein